MPVDAKEALKRLDIDPETLESFEDLDAMFNERFVKKETAHLDSTVSAKALGKINGLMKDKLKGASKALGVDFDESKAPLESFNDLVGHIAAKAEELKTAKRDGSTTEEVAKLQQELETAKNKLNETIQLKDDALAKLTETVNNWSAEKLKAKTDASYDRAMNGVNWKKDMSKFERSGLEAYIRANFVVKFDEEGNETLVDKEGKGIKDPKKTAQMLDLDSAIKQYAEAEKLLEAEGAKVPVRTNQPMGAPQKTAPPQEGNGVRRKERKLAADY